MVYVLMIDNFNDLEVECKHSDIIGVYSNFEKAKNKLQDLLSSDINDYDFVYDKENVNINDILVNDTIRVFKNSQENWSCYSEYTIIDKGVE